MKKGLLIGIVVGVVILGIVLFFLLRPTPEEDTGGLSESELLELCATESWPPSGCSAVPDVKGREVCEQCKALE